MEIGLNNVMTEDDISQDNYNTVMCEIELDTESEYTPYWELPIPELEKNIARYQSELYQINEFIDYPKYSVLTDIIQKLQKCIDEKREAESIFVDMPINNDISIEEEPAIPNTQYTDQSKPEPFKELNKDRNEVSSTTPDIPSYQISEIEPAEATRRSHIKPPNKFHYVNIPIALLPEITKQEQLEELKVYSLMITKKCVLYPDYYLLRGVIQAIHDRQQGKSNFKTAFLDHWQLEYKEEIPRSIAYGKINPEHAYFTEHAKKVKNWLNTYGILEYSRSYFKTLMATHQKIDIYAVMEKYDSYDTSCYGSVKLSAFKLPLMEFKALVSMRSIVGDQLFNPDGYKSTTVKAVMGRMVGAKSKEVYDKLHPRGHPLERNHCGRISTLIKTLQKKKLIKKHYFRDLDHRKIYLTINLSAEQLKEKIIMVRENKKQKDEQDRKQRLFDQWAFRVKDMSKDQQLNYSIRGLDQQDLIKFLLQNDIRREGEMQQMKDDILKMQNFFTLVINGDRYIDSKQRTPKELREALNKVDDYFN